jgi:hypothetical protein
MRIRISFLANRRLKSLVNESPIFPCSHLHQKQISKSKTPNSDLYKRKIISQIIEKSTDPKDPNFNTLKTPFLSIPSLPFHYFILNPSSIDS